MYNVAIVCIGCASEWFCCIYIRIQDTWDVYPCIICILICVQICSLSSVVYSQLLVYKLDSLMHMFLNVINCARMPFIAQECYQLCKNAINCARIPEQASQTSVCTVDCTRHTICPPYHAPAGPAESVIEECWLPRTAGNRSNKDTRLTLHWYHVESLVIGTMLIHMCISGTFATASDLSMWNWLVIQTCTASRILLA